jgi:hypothetical protein
MAWARRHGFGRLVVVNLFAARATKPTALNTLSYGRAVGAGNDEYLKAAAEQADALVAGWGNPNGLRPARYHRRIAEVIALVAGRPIYRVGPPTRQGHPRHGLWWRADMGLRLIDFSGWDAKLGPASSTQMGPLDETPVVM